MSRLLFLLLVIPSFAFSNSAISLVLHAGDNNKSVTLSWNFDNSQINKTNFESTLVYRKLEKDTVFSLIHFSHSFYDTTYTDKKDVDLALHKYYYLIKTITNNPSDTICSDTISPIFLSLFGQGQTPQLRCPFSKEELTVYRKYYYENNFKNIAQFSPPVFYDDSIEICTGPTDYNISYYVCNNDLSSISEIKSDFFKDENNPEWPTIKAISVIDDNALEMSWNPSPSYDVDHYLIMCQSRNASYYDGWRPFDSIEINANENSYIVDDDFCNKVLNNNTIFLKKFAVFAYDSCGNPSLIGNYDKSKIIVFPPILQEVTFDGCSNLLIKWNNYKSVCGKVSSYILEYENNAFKGNIIIDTTMLISDSMWYTYNLDLYNYNELFSNLTTSFRMISKNVSNDSAISCWKDIYISQITHQPDTVNILQIKSYSENKSTYNKIDIIIDENPISYLSYSLTKKYNNTITTIWSSESSIIEPKLSLIDDISGIDSHVDYNLKVTDACGRVLNDSSYLSSLYLVGQLDAINPTNFILSCNTINSNKNQNIDYQIVMKYKSNEIYSHWDIASTNSYNYIIDFYDEGSFASIIWHIEATNENGAIIAISNDVLYTPSSIELKMPNAFIPESENVINTRFGPMNTFDETSIKKYNFQIFNTFGNRVWWSDEYSSDNNGNNDISRWNGKDKKTNKDLVNGTYAYSIQIEFVDPDRPPLLSKGTVTLIRKQ